MGQNGAFDTQLPIQPTKDDPAVEPITIVVKTHISWRKPATLPIFDNLIQWESAGSVSAIGFTEVCDMYFY
ncbi:MAG: hypothetical protein WBD62_12565 [Anaerolineales bacterium]|nr:hypothetical protein [Anaerolineales bacterium]